MTAIPIPSRSPFTTAEAAIAYARSAAQEYARDDAVITEEALGEWLFYASYAEDSSVWVIEKDLGGGEAYEQAMALAQDIASGRA